MMNKILNRMRDPRPWVSTFALLLFVLRTYFKIEVVNSDILINLILTMMGAWGIWKNWGDNAIVPVTIATPVPIPTSTTIESEVITNASNEEAHSL